MVDIIKKSICCSSKLFDIEEVYLAFSASTQDQVTFERIVPANRRSSASVLVIPIVAKKYLLLIREYAVGIEDYVWSLPKGYLELNEEPILAARRELLEETNFDASHLEYLGSWQLSPMYMSMHTHFIRAYVDGWQPNSYGDEPEKMRMQLWPLDNLSNLISQPWFSESRAALAVMLQQLQWQHSNCRRKTSKTI